MIRHFNCSPFGVTLLESIFLFFPRGIRMLAQNLSRKVRGRLFSILLPVVYKTLNSPYLSQDSTVT
jgi:ABC-type Fe3+ transport system permease subunit